MTLFQNSTPPTLIHLSGPSRRMVSTFSPYRDHHAIIKAIEKSSLQATFGPEIVSTGDLLPKNSEAPRVTVKAHHNSTIDRIKKRLRFKRASSPSAEIHTNTGPIPVELSYENIIFAPDRVTSDDGGSPIVTNQHNSSQSVWSFDGDNLPAISDFENNSALSMQSNFFGQLSMEILGQKVSIHAHTP